MARDRTIGATLVVVAVAGVLIYGSLMFVFTNELALLTLKVTAFVAISATLAILGWIGYIMATTPPPVPLEAPSAASAQAEATASEKEGTTPRQS